MPNLFEKARTWLPAQMEAAAGVGPVTYTRARTLHVVTLSPWVGRTLFATSREAGGASVAWGDRDYLVPRDQLRVGGVEFEPDDGDRLVEVIGGVACTFEVMKPDTGEPAWRWSDTGETTYRLHVKKVA